MIYPIMQMVDIARLNVDAAVGGIDQRKIHMLAREYLPSIGIKAPLCIHTPILNGLDGKKVFKHLGHNPYSGHLHYQCPSCRVVLLVPPMDILEGKSLRGVPSHPENRPSFAMIFSNILYRIAKFRKVFQRTPAFP